MRNEDGDTVNITKVPMPAACFHKGESMPASYANFYITNKSVIVPTYRDSNDDTAINIIQSKFPSRKVIGIDSTDLIWGLGSFHCLTQQEPLI